MSAFATTMPAGHCTDSITISSASFLTACEKARRRHPLILTCLRWQTHQWSPRRPQGVEDTRSVCVASAAACIVQDWKTRGLRRQLRQDESRADNFGQAQERVKLWATHDESRLRCKGRRCNTTALGMQALAPSRAPSRTQANHLNQGYGLTEGRTDG